MDPSPSLWFCAFTTATLWPELLVSIGPRPLPSFCACKKAWLAPEKLVSMGPIPHLSFCASKTTWLASELLVSMGPSPHLWFLRSKQRIELQNYKSLRVPALICGFCVQNSELSFRITILYGSQPSPVVFAFKTETLGPELHISMGPSPHLWFLRSKQRI